MQRFIRTSIATAALLAAAPAAFAATFASGVLQATSGSRLVCMVTNLGTTTLPVEVILVHTSGGGISFGGDCLTGEIAPWASCEMHSQPGVANSGHCRVSAPGTKVRASLLVVNGANVVTSSLPLTK
jgi:hypothetical protein